MQERLRMLSNALPLSDAGLAAGRDAGPGPVPRSPARRRALTWSAGGCPAVALPLALYSGMISMPGTPHRGPLPPLTDAQLGLSAVLRRDVTELAEKIGERHVERYSALAQAADYVEAELRSAGHVSRQTYRVGDRDCHNLELEWLGDRAAEEIVVVGAHYDSVPGSPGANDNATGVAGLLALARSLAGARPSRTLRWVAFVNEEPPRYRTELMGSRVYARRCRSRNENVVAMLSLETIGCFTDAPGSQRYPALLRFFYPSEGSFIAFVGNVSSRSLVRRSIASFRGAARFPSEGAAIPGFVPGVGWSDHESFWREGYPAVMVTDTAPFRYASYHTREDTPDKVDFDRCARVVEGLRTVITDLAGIPP